MNPLVKEPLFFSQSLPVSPPFVLADIAADLQNIPENDWVDHVNKKGHEGSWSVVPLRTLKTHKNAHPILQSFAIQDGGSWENLPRFDALPAIKAIVDFLPLDFQSVRLMRLKPGAHIKPHTDSNLGAEYGELRLHVPLKTNNNVIFICGDKQLKMSHGELWYVNAAQVHSVQNLGDSDRINLVMDCTFNQWLKDRLV